MQAQSGIPGLSRASFNPLHCIFGSFHSIQFRFISCYLRSLRSLWSLRCISLRFISFPFIPFISPPVMSFHVRSFQRFDRSTLDASHLIDQPPHSFHVTSCPLFPTSSCGVLVFGSVSRRLLLLLLLPPPPVISHTS
jgi:hypothetical protein